MENGRLEALRDLILLRRPVADASVELRNYSWDSSEPVIALKRADCVRILDAYLTGALDERTVELWADAVEGRDDIEFDSSDEQMLKQLIFELANPAITRSLTRGTASEWRARLDS